MRFLSSPLDAALLSTALLSSFTSAISIDCTNVVVNKKSYDLSKLGGPRSTIHSIEHGNGTSFTKTAYTIDICAPLKPAKDQDKEHRCPAGTRICAIQRFTKPEQGDEKAVDSILDVFPVAGELKDFGGKSLDPQWLALKDSTSHSDSAKEGLSLELNGGFNDEDGKQKAQKAIIEFICDPKVEGTENLYDPEDKYEKRSILSREEDKNDSKNGSCMYDLSFVRYDQTNADVDVLRLSWRTLHACENAKDLPGGGNEDGDKSTAHWGFFTWFILIAFLGTAAYLIFGSWLNYNRYGARGWDLVPHGDAIRDVPYLMKDWTRKVVNSVQGGGSRGGYAAV